MKKTSTTIRLIIAIAATVWHYADAHEEASRLYEQGNVAELTQRAEQGDALASYYIAQSYLQGEHGLEKDIPQGRQWLQKAVEQGHEKLSVTLHIMDSKRAGGRYYSYIYDTQGEMAAQAVSDAAPKWLEQGILLGDTEALSWLNLAYSGDAYPIKRAAELIPALHAMEKSLKNTSGKFLSRDEEFLYHQLLGVLYFAEGDYANALIYLEKATNITEPADQYSRRIEQIDTDQRSSVAYHLGRIYEEGLGIDSDAHKARETYATTPQNAQKKDDRLAMWHLAMMQAQGRGGDVDKESAAELLQKLESVSRDDVYSPAVLDFPSAEQMDALREAIAAP